MEAFDLEFNNTSLASMNPIIFKAFLRRYFGKTGEDLEVF